MLMIFEARLNKVDGRDYKGNWSEISVVVIDPSVLGGMTSIAKEFRQPSCGLFAHLPRYWHTFARVQCVLAKRDVFWSATRLQNLLQPRFSMRGVNSWLIYPLSSPTDPACINTALAMDTTTFNDIPPGYPRHAALASRDKAYCLFRKFLTLNCRNLLHLQSEMIDLESQLQKVDKNLGEDEDQRRLEFIALKSWSAFSQNEERARLFSEIRSKLQLYSKHRHFLEVCCI